MTVNSEPFVYAGLQSAYVYELNANGRPKGAGLTAYSGYEVYGPQVFTLNIPEPRRVPHAGNDRLLLTQIFPSKEAITGELQVAAEDLDLLAAVTGLTVQTLAGGRFLPHATDLQGKEPNVGMILQQAAVSESGLSRYHWHVIPNTRAVPRLPGMGENPEPMRFTLAPNPITRYLWGPNVVDDTSGAAQSAVQSGFSADRLRIAAFVADGIEDTFAFDAALQAIDENDIEVYTASGTTVTKVTSNITKAKTGVTFSYPAIPADETEVILLYQHA
jgi:hypothetical protein